MPANLSLLIPQTAGAYTVRGYDAATAGNKVYESAQVNVTAAPGALPATPTQAADTGTTSSGTTMNWTATATSYRVLARPGVGTVYGSLAGATVSTNSYTFTGLAPSSGPRAVVIPHNANGFGTPSGQFVSFTAAAPAPGQVTGLTLSATSSFVISASWNAPTSGAAVTAYKRQFRAVGSATWNTRIRNVSGNAFSDLSETLINGVSPDTSYEVVITAIAAGVEGLPSATVATHTPAVPAPPGPPTAFSAGTITSTTVALSWAAPTSGETLQGYRVEMRTPAGSDTWVDLVFVGGSVGYTATGLTPSTSYEFRVSAYNDGGYGSPSDSLTITTAA